jgi:hypothetical protein
MKEMVRREFRLVLALSDYAMKLRRHDTESKTSGNFFIYSADLNYLNISNKNRIDLPLITADFIWL